MVWLDPWWPVVERGPEFATASEGVLRREVGPGHPLYGIPTEAIGKHDGSDEVLYRLLDGSGRVVVVHLTWTRSPPERPPWPAAQVYADLEAWVEQRMKPDHAGFGA